MSEFAIGLIGTSALLILVFAGVRVFVVAAIVGLLGCVAIIGWKAGAGISGTVPHSKSINYALSVLPMFILIGFIAYHGGLTHALFRAARNWFGCCECFCDSGVCCGVWCQYCNCCCF